MYIFKADDSCIFLHTILGWVGTTKKKLVLEDLEGCMDDWFPDCLIRLSTGYPRNNRVACCHRARVMLVQGKQCHGLSSTNIMGHSMQRRQN